MEIRSFGVGERISECHRLLSEHFVAEWGGEILLLPIPSTRDNRYITGTSVEIADLLPIIKPGVRVVGYNIPSLLTEAAAKLYATVYDAALDEDFLIANAELTARGAVGYILTHYKKDISDMSVGVVGYGRIGMRLARWLLLFGARLTVYTTRESLALELCEAGISAKPIEKDLDLTGLDILINTAPARQIDEEMLDKQTEIIDLASGNYFSPSERLTKLSSIPELYYPRTAGRLYAEGAIRALRGDSK